MSYVIHTVLGLKTLNLLIFVLFLKNGLVANNVISTQAGLKSKRYLFAHVTEAIPEEM